MNILEKLEMLKQIDKEVYNGMLHWLNCAGGDILGSLISICNGLFRENKIKTVDDMYDWWDNYYKNYFSLYREDNREPIKYLNKIVERIKDRVDEHYLSKLISTKDILDYSNEYVYDSYYLFECIESIIENGHVIRQYDKRELHKPLMHGGYCFTVPQLSISSYKEPKPFFVTTDVEFAIHYAHKRGKTVNLYKGNSKIEEAIDGRTDNKIDVKLFTLSDFEDLKTAFLKKYKNDKKTIKEFYDLKKEWITNAKFNSWNFFRFAPVRDIIKNELDCDGWYENEILDEEYLKDHKQLQGREPTLNIGLFDIAEKLEFQEHYNVENPKDIEKLKNKVIEIINKQEKTKKQ